MNTLIKYLRDSIYQLARSFTHCKTNFLLTLIYDWIFYLALMLITGGYVWYTNSLNNTAAQMNVPFAVTQPDLISMLPGELRMYFIKLLIATLAYALVLVLAYTFFKGLIWHTLLNKTPAKGYYWRTYIANVCFSLIILAVGTFFTLVTQPNFLVLIYLFILALTWHFHTLFTYNYITTRRVRTALAHTITLGLINIRHFILPYVYAIILFLIYQNIWYAIPQNTTMTTLTGITFFVIIAPPLAWWRIYLTQLLPKITGDRR